MKRRMIATLSLLLALTCAVPALAADAAPNPAPRVLNNFVTELFSTPQTEAQDRCAHYTNPRDGWVRYERVDADGGKRERMQFRPKGPNPVTIPAGACVSVRTVPELMFCYYPSSSHIAAYGPYTKEYMAQHVFPNVNVLVTTSATAPSDFPEWGKAGGRWIANSPLPGLSDKEAPKAGDVLAVWAKNPAVTQPGYAGVIVDEFIGAAKGHYRSWSAAVEGLLDGPDFKDKTFYAWCGDLYAVKHERAFAKMLMKRNQRFVWETYLTEEPTEKEAASWMHQRVAERMGAWKKKLPGVERQTVVCLGYLSAPPESLNSLPGVDYQVFLDMQFHMLATDPAFKGLYGLMEYMAAYADEESLQYAHRLIRHYCIEGRIDRMNADPYLLPHLSNPDFAQGLDGWTVQAADRGGIAAGKMDKFSWLQGRYPETKEGDTYCGMRRSAKAPNRLTQTIRALEPDRVYSVKLISANLDALDTKEPTSLSVAVEGAEIVPGMDFQCVYPSCYSHEAGSYTRDHPAHFSFHRLVFKATAQEATLTIQDWKDANTPGGPAGQTTAFNFVEVQPCHLDLGRR